MTAPTNLSFETADGSLAVGGAASWTATPTAGFEALADFNGGTLPWEAFEGGWSSNESYTFHFVDVTHLERAGFDASVGTTEGVEDFEEGWSANEHFSFAIGLAAAAQFDTAPEVVEDFEENWSNDTYLGGFVSGDISAALFDSGANATETFSTGWRNTSFATSLTDYVNADPAYFQLAGSGQPYESFEVPLLPALATVDISTNVFNAPGHGFADGYDVLFTGEVLPAPLQKRVVYFVRDTSGSTFKVAATLGGTAIDITDVGVGSITAGGNPAKFWITKMTTI